MIADSLLDDINVPDAQVIQAVETSQYAADQWRKYRRGAIDIEGMEAAVRLAQIGEPHDDGAREILEAENE